MKYDRICFLTEELDYNSRVLVRASRILDRCKGRARGIYDRLVAGDRLSGKQIFAGAQWRITALTPGGGFWSHQMVFSSNQADRFWWGDGKDEAPHLAQDTSPSGQVVQQ